MKTLIKNGHLIDPKNKKDGVWDLLIENGRVLDVLKPGKKIDADIVDAKGCIVAPGFVDLHTHLREPGEEYKETIHTGTMAAAAGGFTSVCCMANTLPVNDNASVTRNILKQARETGVVNVFPIGALTLGLKGETLTPMSELKKAGCIALSDDGKAVANAQVMRLAMEYAKSFNLPVITHSIDPVLAGKGTMNEGFTSTRLGLAGIPNEAEDIMIARDIYLAKLTGASLHVAHVSTREGVRQIAWAKKAGLPVTCEVSPHHFTLTDEAIGCYNTHAKMAPPLRSDDDRQALIEGLADGTIDAIATDHAPHGIIDKEIEFGEAACGVVGLETALSLALQLVEKKKITLKRMIELFTINPSKIVFLQKGSLGVGDDADVVVFDPKISYTVDPSRFYSKSRNTPFVGMKVKGKVKYTVVGGKVVYKLL